MNRFDGIALGASIATLDGDGYGAIADGALAWKDGLIAWVGERSALPAGASAEVRLDFGGGWITPGLVDCHTHLVFAGVRAGEF
jgi:imidazolonepropionase